MSNSDPNFEEDFRRLVDAYVTPNRPSKFKVFVELLQPVSIAVGVIAVILTLPQVTSWLRDSQENDELKPLARSEYSTPAASSAVDPSVGRSSSLSYTPGNVLDDNSATAWQECSGEQLVTTSKGSTQECARQRKDLEGKNEWIELRLVGQTDLRGFRVRNGYQRSYNLYRANPRVEHVRVAAMSRDDASPILEREFVLLDDFAEGYQYFELDGGRNLKGVSAVRFTILSAYPSEKIDGQQWSDNGLSDVQLVPYRMRGTSQ